MNQCRLVVDIDVIHVIAGLDESHGGPSYSVPRLCAALAQGRAKPTLFSVAANGADGSDNCVDGYRHRSFAWDYGGIPILRGLRQSSGLAAALREAARNTSVIHDHGLWLMPNLVAGWEAARARKPFVVSPRGMLSPAALRYSRWKKGAVWSLLQGRIVRSAACLHATSEQEYRELRAFGLVNPIAIVPNGIDLPQGATQIVGGNRKVVLSLGRVHPKKGLDRLLRAWATVEKKNPEWRLRISGPGEGGHDDELRALAAVLRLKRVSIEGPVYGDEKSKAYRDAALFVLPTLNENFGLTVAEALAAAIPAISTKGAPWSGLETEGCGWWVDHGVESLASAVDQAMAMPPEVLRTMGLKGRAWMERQFSWSRVGRDMADVYSWLARGSEAPATVRFH